MFGTARKPLERRAEPRRKVQLGCWLSALDGSGLTQCHALDFSAAGARVKLADLAAIPPTVCFLDMPSRLVYEARVAWRKAPEMGLQFLKVWRFDEAPPTLKAAIAAASS